MLDKNLFLVGVARPHDVGGDPSSKKNAASTKVFRLLY